LRCNISVANFRDNGFNAALAENIRGAPQRETLYQYTK